MTDAADALVRRIEAIDTVAADNRHRVESFQRMAEQMRAADGRATSEDGSVTVVAAADGTIRSITFSEKIHAVTPMALSATALHTIAKARANAARMQAEIVRGALGDTELLDRVLDSNNAMFGDERPRDPGPAPAAQAPTPRHAAHDDEGEFSVFKNNRSSW